MKEFEITYFDNGDASSGTPYTVCFKGRDEQEARVQFHYHYPTRKIWSIEEVEE